MICKNTKATMAGSFGAKTRFFFKDNYESQRFLHLRGEEDRDWEGWNMN